MALIVKDRVRETTTTTGTGTVTLAGPVTGYQSFSVIGNANTTYYTIADSAAWEVGIGTYTASGTTLSRDTILESSNGGTAVNFSAGTKDVFVTYPAEESVYQDGTSIAAGTSVLGVANGGTGTNTAFTTGSVVFAGASGVYSQDNINLFWDDTNNRLGVGTSSPVSPLHVEGGLATFQRYGSSGAIALRSAAGTQASPTAIASATSIGIVISRGYDGSAYRDIAAITCSSDGAISSNSSPGFIQFSTTPSGSVASTERMRITSAGNVGIATTSAPSPLTVAGTVESTTGGFKFPDGTTQTTAAIGGGANGLQDTFMLMGA